MYVAYLDESGYQYNWDANIHDQPFYVLSVVCLPADRLSDAYTAARLMVQEAGAATTISGVLGKGTEIKASDIARGLGPWKDNTPARNAVREGYLSIPSAYGGTVIVVVVDKQAHKDKYPHPNNPYLLALRYGMERLEWVLRRNDSYAICIYDQNTRLQADINTETAALLAQGSRIQYVSDFYRDEVVYNHEIEHVLELAHGDSKNSIGLQLADFFATMTYQYFKGGCQPSCDWWRTLKAQLDRKNGALKGYGLKLVPQEAFKTEL